VPVEADVAAVIPDLAVVIPDVAAVMKGRALGLSSCGSENQTDCE
jgi:hypothetical protein